MASRYDALAEHLQQQSGTRYTMSFADIERVIGHKLPPSSKPNHRGFRTWWYNDHSPTSRHVQARCGWIAAGWEVDSLDPVLGTVTFRR